jgi:hypothetical protein
MQGEAGCLCLCVDALSSRRAVVGWIFAGGVSVSPDQRRKALGSYVNAALLADSQKAFNWRCALEQAKVDNAAGFYADVPDLALTCAVLEAM